jgi:hypothetical protein
VLSSSLHRRNSPGCFALGGATVAISGGPVHTLEQFVSAPLFSFPWSLLITVGKTKTLTVYTPRPGEGPVAVPIIFIGTQRVKHGEQFKYLGQVIYSHGTVNGEFSPRLGLAHAAVKTMGKQGIWTDKTPSGRTNLTIYKFNVRTLLLYCAETWSIGPADVRRLVSAQMSCLRRICRDHVCRSWGPDYTP